jgi:hypothetical protein
MKSSIKNGKIRQRLTVWLKLLTGAAVICSVALPKSAQAIFRSNATPSFSARATKVKNAVDQLAPGMNPTLTPPKVMQWGNWPNWQNWGNWGNWNNWNNWPNWVNW